MNRTSTGNKPVFSASSVRDTIAETLSAIKEEDGLTYADMGRVMGKSGDRAEAYCNGDFSDMSGFSLLAAWREWNGRFVGPLRTLVEGSRPGGAHCDHAGQSAILKAALAISVALQDGEVDPEEVRAEMRVVGLRMMSRGAQLAALPASAA